VAKMKAKQKQRQETAKHQTKHVDEVVCRADTLKQGALAAV
jgi:hypothetical protein